MKPNCYPTRFYYRIAKSLVDSARFIIPRAPNWDSVALEFRIAELFACLERSLHETPVRTN
jgi:hypothetical protein